MTTGDCEAPVVDDSMAKIREQSFDINVSGHRSAQRDQKIRNLANKGSTAGERAAAAGKLKGPTLPLANSYELEGNQLDENPLAVGAALGVAAGGAYLVKKAAEAGKAMRKNAEKRMGIKEAQDHEVAMAQSQLDSAAKNINTLKKSLGKKEKNIPAWMQAKITDTAHNMDAAATYKEGVEIEEGMTMDDFKKQRRRQKEEPPIRKRGGISAPEDERSIGGEANRKNKDYWASVVGKNRDRGAGNKSKRRASELNKEEFEIEEGMSLKDFKANRKKNERRAASADAEKRGHVGKEWYNTGRKYSADDAKSNRAKMSDDDRAARHRAAVDPDDDRDENTYSADKTKNPKKLRKQQAMGESAAWTRSEGKNKAGGLNEKGRKSYEAENPGSDLKAPSKEKGNKRRASFCARMKGMKKKLTSAKTASDPDSRINKSLRAWDC